MRGAFNYKEGKNIGILLNAGVSQCSTETHACTAIAAIFYVFATGTTLHARTSDHRNLKPLRRGTSSTSPWGEHISNCLETQKTSKPQGLVMHCTRQRPWGAQD